MSDCLGSATEVQTCGGAFKEYDWLGKADLEWLVGFDHGVGVVVVVAVVEGCVVWPSQRESIAGAMRWARCRKELWVIS